MENKNNAILRDWKLERMVSAKGDPYILSGHIYNDSKMRFLDGTFIRTSKIINIDFESMIAETKNTKYDLKDMRNQ